MRLLIVIVNYRTADLTIDCLHSLANEIAPLQGARVVVTDAASDDGSVSKLCAAVDNFGWNAWVSVLPLGKNGGFAYGNNAAIQPALKSDNKPDFVLLLNPDTIVRNDGVGELLKFMQENPKVGIAGSRLENVDGTAQRSAFRFLSAWGELDGTGRSGFLSRMLSKYIVAPPNPASAGPTDWVAGASMMVRREVFEEIGLLDPEYFMYYEEVDFCRRAALAGWPTWYVPASRVVHLVGQASGVNSSTQKERRRPAYWFRSRRRYFVKNHGTVYAMFTDLLWIAGMCLWQTRRVIERKPDIDPPHFVRDFLQHSVLTG